MQRFFSVFPFRNTNRCFIRSEAQIVGVTWGRRARSVPEVFLRSVMEQSQGLLEHLAEKRLGRYLCVSSSQRRPRWKTKIHHHQEAVRSIPCQRPVRPTSHLMNPLNANSCCRCPRLLAPKRCAAHVTLQGSASSWTLWRPSGILAV